MAYQKLLLVALLALACTAPSCLPQRQEIHYYVVVPQKLPENFCCELENVKLVSYLDRHELTYLADNGELVRLPKAKWAQSLGTVIKEYLVMALRPRQAHSAAVLKGAVTIDQFLMTADGKFQVAGIAEYRLGKEVIRNPFAFELPSKGQPSIETVVAQTRAALEQIVMQLQSKGNSNNSI